MHGQKLDRGPTESIGMWIAFLSKPIDQRILLLSNIRGGKIMFSANKTLFLIIICKLDLHTKLDGFNYSIGWFDWSKSLYWGTRV